MFIHHAKINPVLKTVWHLSIYFRSVAMSLLWGLEKYTGDYYDATITLPNSSSSPVYISCIS